MTARPFRRLAVVNRGEAAMRLITAVRELNETRADPITLIALYTEPERHAMFVRLADESYCLGPATTVGADGRRMNGYLDHAALERALVDTRADAAWPGWGFVAEQPEFADLCDRLGIVFVGPSGAVMRRLGDKIEAKRLAAEAGVPVAPWSGGPVADLADARRHADAIGFPLMIKAAAGGGGRGIRRVDEPAELAGALAAARAEAHEAFGDDTVFMERLVTPARHIEVQIVADGAGAAWAVGVRDCSCQRRHQKVIEESSSPALTAAQEAELRAAARRLVLLSGYGNAGTVEFLYQPTEQRFSFMEVNARLQVEHPVTEAVTGLDLVKLQLHVAAGGRLEGEPPAPSGHAIEARLNAEDPALGFAPTPGTVQRLELPTGPGVRVDRGISAGDAIPAEFDSMVAKIIAVGHDRAEALGRLRRALRDTVVVLDGGTTNRSFLLALLNRPELRSGEIDTTWLDRLEIGADTEGVQDAHVALVQAAIELADEEVATDRASFFALARRGRPAAHAEMGRNVEVRYRGQTYRLRVWQPGPGRRRVTLDGGAADVEVESLSAHERRLVVAGRRHRTLISRQGTDLLVEVDGVPHRISRDDGGLVRSHAPAVVVAIPVAPGDEVAAGQVVAVLESMKMEMSFTAPFAGRVRQVLAGPNVQVAAHAPLVQLEPLDGAREPASGERVALPAEAVPAVRAEGRCARDLGRLEWLLLGYDVPDDEVERTLAELEPLAAEPACEPMILAGEHRLLDLYADLRALARPRRDADGDAELVRSPQEYLHAYLRSLDAAAEALPEPFVTLLERALARYGVDRRERTPALADACYRLFLSQQRTGPTRRVVLSVLDRRRARAAALVGRMDDTFRALLDRLESATEGRDAAIADSARELRYAYYDAPLVEAAREAAYAAMEPHLRALDSDPHRADRDAHVRALVDCPQAMAPILTSRMSAAAPDVRAVLLETMTRRYYRPWPLEPFGTVAAGGVSLAVTHYARDGRRHHLVSAFVELGALDAAVRALAAHVAALPEADVVLADFYARADAGALPSRLAGLPANVARVVVAAAAPERGRGMSAVDLVTLVPGGDGELVEDPTLRGLHPEMAHRLRLWRYSEFALERLPSAEDVYLLHGTANANPKDERLFAIAEVRDLTPVRDADGSVASLPELERMLGEALAAIRRAQARRPPRERPLWNRVVLHVWPPIDVAVEDVRAVVARHEQMAGGLGIEMVVVSGRLPDPVRGLQERVLRFHSLAGRGLVAEVGDAPQRPLQPLDEGARRIVQARRRGTVHPAELVRLLPGSFEELDLDASGELVPAARPPATNEAGIVVGLARAPSDRYPEGMQRVVLLGDPTKALGSLAEPECRRILAALDLAERQAVPLEWFALSAGAKIAMDSGTENMDWIAAVLRRIVEYTQAGGELNVVVTGINVGAQPYWNAEATMLMHTRGILVMTPDSAMVLTGKQSLDYAGGVSAEDNFGIGGYERIMGPNGQAQYWTPDLASACRLLISHYDHTYVAPGERFPRRGITSDPLDRDVRAAPHHAPGSALERVGDVFSDERNPERKQPFDIRSVMRAVADADHEPLERWGGMRDAETAVVWHACLGGRPVCLIGFESHPLVRSGLLPADGPEQWTSGTLFPRSSKKVARALNAASGHLPVVALANLAGFDGSPESMREWQLEFGAEIGRAVVNFRGPIVFCVVSRYHGGAFVVFSRRLNEQLEAVAVEGARASVIGGSAAAGVVFAREVETAARQDPRIVALEARLADTDAAGRQALRAEHAALWERVRAEKRGELAARFDAVHSVERAVRMGSVDRTVAPAALRAFLIDAVERGIARTEATAVEAANGHRVADTVSA